MEISKKGNIITIKKRLKKDETYKLSQSSKFETISFYKKPQVLNGIASTTADNMEVLFMDYDTDELAVVLRDYKLIQEKFDLPRAYLFKTKKGYHVICLKKMTPTEIFTILSHTHVDSAYMNMPLRNKYRNWILRISTKENAKRPKFVRLIGEEYDELGDAEAWNQVSGAHMKFLTVAYPKIKHPNYGDIDKYLSVFVQKYEAS